MRTYCKIAVLGSLLAAAGAAIYRRWMIRMPFRTFTRYALYMAVMDDEICRNELAGNQIGDEQIQFPHRMKTLQERYHLFLQRNQGKNRRQLLDEITAMEQRLRDSRQYISQPKEQLEVDFQ